MFKLITLPAIVLLFLFVFAISLLAAPISPLCQPIDTEIKALQSALRLAAPGDKPAYAAEIKLRKADLALCMKLHPALVTSPANPAGNPTGKTPQLNPICAEIDQEIKDLQKQLSTAAPGEKAGLASQIKKQKDALAKCKAQHPK